MTDTKPQPQCARCGAAQADWMLCNRCVARMRADLERITDLWPDLQDVILGQTRFGAGGKRVDRSMPYRHAPVVVADASKATLVAIIRGLDMGDIDCDDTVPAMCAWIAGRMERVRSASDAEEIADQIDYVCKDILRTVDRPAELEFCGACPICGKDLYARKGTATDTCRHCKVLGFAEPHVYEPAVQRERIRLATEDHLGTVGECALILGTFGMEVKRETVQDWTRHRLEQHGQNARGRALYRFGDVMDVAKEHQQKESERHARRTRRGA